MSELLEREAGSEPDGPPEDPGEPWERERGPITRPDGRLCIGRVGAPPGQEACSSLYHFWVPPGVLVERTQIVVTESRIGGQDLKFYGIVDEVHRCSRKRSMGHEVDEHDGDLGAVPPFNSEGITYATVSILRTEPPILTPPRERSDVLLALPGEARIAYSADEIERPLEVGLIKNGGSALAGPGSIDTDYLLGVNGGHLNVNGAAGRGTKSSFLLLVNRLLLDKARRQAAEASSNPRRLRVVPIILNVKNFDLFFLDRWSRRYDPQRHLPDWQALSIQDPRPFEGAQFFAAQQSAGSVPVPTGRLGSVTAYSWSLADVIERNLMEFLFSEEDAQSANFSGLLLDVQTHLTEERVLQDGSVRRNLRSGLPQTFEQLVEWVGGQAALADADRALRNHTTGTWRMFYRRLRKAVYEGLGVLRRTDLRGTPLDVVRADTCDPLVIDLSALAGEPSLQRFVVATILQQLIEARTGSNAVRGLVYLVTLDELNRFAPRGARDPITRLIEKVASEMRSQGIILLGAQQQASQVSEKVIENAGIRALGKSGALELSHPVWRSLSASARLKAETLPPSEKLILQDNFREPMHVRVPFPVWAMNPDEVLHPMDANVPEESDLSDLLDQ